MSAPMIMEMTLGQIMQWLPASQGAQLVGDAATPVLRLHTDSRSLQAGDVFLALQGEQFDGHDFLPQLKAAGIQAAVAQQGLQAAGLQGVQVADTRLALGHIAAGWRSQFALPLIAVTGSNGKTTVTQMIASILRAAYGDAAHATQGNLNNDIGVPQTLLKLRSTHRASVVELGMNHPGEIAYLAHIAQATVALINNAQREHLEFMHSVQAVAEENGAVLSHLPANGVAVLPMADAYLPLWQKLAGDRRVLTFGLNDTNAHVNITGEWQGSHWAAQLYIPMNMQVGSEGTGELTNLPVTIHLAGEHNLRNAAAAAACALAAGVALPAIAQGLSAFQPVGGRSRALALRIKGQAVTLIDDTYNANPDSVRAAVDVLASLPAPRLLVLGDMGEVGTQGPAFHAEVGAYAATRGIDALLAAGELCAHTHAAFVGTHLSPSSLPSSEAAAQHVISAAGQYASILVKGSRFMKMERVVQALQTLSDQREPTSMNSN